jgi:hypothetical protein
MLRYLLLFTIVFLLTGCAYHELPVNCSQTGLEIHIDTLIAASSCGAADGSLTVSAQGGQAPYQFSLDGISWKTETTFAGLNSNPYTIYVSDGMGCKVFIDSVISVSNFDATISSTADNVCLGGNGSISLQVNESNGPYTYSIDGGEFQSVPLYQNIDHGNHYVSIKDNNGCQVVLSVPVQRGSTEVSWQLDILPIMKTSCATSKCHDGKSRLDWRDYSNAKKYAQEIKETTQNRSMPFDGSLSQDQIATIACWVDDGALNN